MCLHTWLRCITSCIFFTDMAVQPVATLAVTSVVRASPAESVPLSLQSLCPPHELTQLAETRFLARRHSSTWCLSSNNLRRATAGWGMILHFKRGFKFTLSFASISSSTSANTGFLSRSISTSANTGFLSSLRYGSHAHGRPSHGRCFNLGPL